MDTNIDAMKKYSYINSARGIAIIMVIVIHCTQIYTYTNELLRFFLTYGQRGVQLFFVASAFTLCLSRDARKNELFFIRNFYIRRFFRIFPIYYLGIIIYFTFRYFLGSVKDYTFSNILYNLTFLNVLVPSARNSIVPGGWSISTEMLFYLIFPFIFVIFKDLRKMFLVILFCFIGFLILYLGGIKFDASFRDAISEIKQLPVFLVGILYYKYHKKINLTTAFFVFISFFVLAYFLWITEYFFLMPLTSGVSFCGLMKILEKTKLDNIVFQRIGIVLYSIYIIHFVFPFFIFPSTNSILVFILYVLITIALCYPIGIFLQKYVEMFFINMGNNLIKYLNSKKQILS